MQCRTSASIHPPHHRAGYASVRPFCMTGRARRSSWLRSHHRQRAYPADNGYTVADILPPLVCQQAVTIQPIWEYQKPYNSGTVLLIPSRHGGFVPDAAVEKDLLILEPIPSSRQASLGQGPQGTLSGDKLPQERPCEHSGQCPKGCGLPAPSLMLCVRSWWYSSSISTEGTPRRAGGKCMRITSSRCEKNGAVLATTRWTYCQSFCVQKVKPVYTV